MKVRNRALNIIAFKRWVRSLPGLGKLADNVYLGVTGQLTEERHCVKGQTPYYIIRPQKGAHGLISLYIDVIDKMSKALERGYKPVVDLENYRTVYSGGELNGNKNVWEWYFVQPFGNSLSEAYQSGYILSHMADRTTLIKALLNSDEAVLRSYCEAARNIKICQRAKDEMQKYLDNEDFNGGKNVLGVFCRGSDYTQYKPIRHPVQPTLGELIKRASEKMEAWGCDRIFLTTEEKESVDAFKAAFPGRVITVDQQLVENYSVDKGYLIEDFKTRMGADHYQSGLGYLASVVMLSRCDCFLGAVAGGSIGALIMNDLHYREREIINLGVYK